MKVGEYARYRKLNFNNKNDIRIAKIIDIQEESGYHDENGNDIKFIFFDDKNGEYEDRIINSNEDITNVIEYEDLIYLQNKVKLYTDNREVRFFNPVRVDGFTEYEDGVHCIILDLDYIVNVKELKIKGVITHEQLEQIKYKVESEVN